MNKNNFYDYIFVSDLAKSVLMKQPIDKMKLIHLLTENASYEILTKMHNEFTNEEKFELLCNISRFEKNLECISFIPYEFLKERVYKEFLPNLYLAYIITYPKEILNLQHKIVDIIGTADSIGCIYLLKDGLFDKLNNINKQLLIKQIILYYENLRKITEISDEALSMLTKVIKENEFAAEYILLFPILKNKLDLLMDVDIDIDIFNVLLENYNKPIICELSLDEFKYIILKLEELYIDYFNQNIIFVIDMYKDVEKFHDFLISIKIMNELTNE